MKFEDKELTISPRAKSKIDRINNGIFTDKVMSQSQIVIPKINTKFKHKPKHNEKLSAIKSSYTIDDHSSAATNSGINPSYELLNDIYNT